MELLPCSARCITSTGFCRCCVRSRALISRFAGNEKLSGLNLNKLETEVLLDIVLGLCAWCAVMHLKHREEQGALKER